MKMILYTYPNNVIFNLSKVGQSVQVYKNPGENLIQIIVDEKLFKLSTNGHILFLERISLHSQ